jgi:adenosine deaminase
MTSTMPRSLVTLPKAHLHLHLEGSMRPSTLRQLCEEQGTPAPAIGGNYTAFADFQVIYVAARLAIRRVEDLIRLVSEVAEDAAADGAVWIEPAIHLPGHQSLGSGEVVLEILIEAGRRATAATGVGVGWLIATDRTLSPELAMEQALTAARYCGEGVVSIGLANDEAACGPEPFGPAFAVARAAGVISAPHAGEHGGPESVSAALDVLGADRVQHGVRAIEDSRLVQRLADDQVCLDVAPTSNVALGVVPSLSAHPLPHLIAAGVACSINADDPLLFGIGLLDEYSACREHLGLSDEDLAHCARASIEHSGAPPDVKVAAQTGIDDWLRS